MLTVILPATDLNRARGMVDEVEALFPGCQIIVSSNRQQLGKGWAVREALKEAKGEFICFLDGDGDIEPRMIKRLIPYLQDYDIVCATKPISGLWSRRMITYWSRLYIALLCGMKVDSQTGLKIFKRHTITEWYNNGWLFDLEILCRAKQKGFTMIEVPIEFNSINKPMKFISLWKTLKESWTLFLELK